MSELLSRPFCGGEASVLRMDYGYGSTVWGVFCTNDSDASFSHGHFIDNYATEAEAIGAWNARANTEQDALPMTEENMRAHGWVRERTCHNVDDNKAVWFICSECGSTKKLAHMGNYCPNCGAKVVEE